MLKNIDRYVKNLIKDSEKLQNSVLFESTGDKDNKLAMCEYSDIIRPYLKIIRLEVNGKYN